MTTLSHLTVAVTSLAASRHFYVDFLGLPALAETEELLVVGGAEGLRVGFAEREWADVGAPGIELGLTVDDLDELLRLLREEGFDVGRPDTDEETGERRTWLRDPDGYRLTVREEAAA